MRALDRVVTSGFRAAQPLLSRIGGNALPSAADLDGFRTSQRLAYSAALEVAATLKPGVTELEAAGRLGDALAARGAQQFLHRPFAWFGPRSRFAEIGGSYGQYHPTDRPLGLDEPYILDCSPVVDGYVADIGYSGCLSPHPGLDRAKEVLRELRASIPGWFASAPHPGEVWDRVAAHVREAGFAATHADYPLAVLGHRLFRLNGVERRTFVGTRLPGGPVASDWFSPHAIARFGARGFASQLLTAEHRGSKLGIWAIEPHLGGEGFGAKFEEILVVEADSARWLDDQVPHA